MLNPIYFRKYSEITLSRHHTYLLKSQNFKLYDDYYFDYAGGYRLQNVDNAYKLYLNQFD